MAVSFQHTETGLGEGHGEIHEITTFDHNFIVGTRDGQIRTLDWGCDVYNHRSLKQINYTFFVAWLLGCRSSEDVEHTMTTFVLK